MTSSSSAPSGAEVDAAVGAAFTAEWGRIVATMIRLTGDWELAEEIPTEGVRSR